MNEDMSRYLEKWEETVTFAFDYFTKQSESHAAQHLNYRVMYSPICNRLDEMLSDIRIVKGTM